MKNNRVALFILITASRSTQQLPTTALRTTQQLQLSKITLRINITTTYTKIHSTTTIVSPLRREAITCRSHFYLFLVLCYRKDVVLET